MIPNMFEGLKFYCTCLFVFFEAPVKEQQGTPEVEHRAHGTKNAGLQQASVDTPLAAGQALGTGSASARTDMQLQIAGKSFL